jgi:hypothetical protein
MQQAPAKMLGNSTQPTQPQSLQIQRYYLQSLPCNCKTRSLCRASQPVVYQHPSEPFTYLGVDMTLTLNWGTSCSDKMANKAAALRPAQYQIAPLPSTK